MKHYLLVLYCTNTVTEVVDSHQHCSALILDYHWYDIAVPQALFVPPISLLKYSFYFCHSKGNLISIIKLTKIDIKFFSQSHFSGHIWFSVYLDMSCDLPHQSYKKMIYWSIFKFVVTIKAYSQALYASHGIGTNIAIIVVLLL